MEKILEPILNSPRLKDHVAELLEYLRSEDERRNFFYNTITEKDKAEFINGKIIFHSPVMLMHNDASSLLYQAIKEYVRYYKLGKMGYEKLMIRLTRNDYEPDLCFFNTEKAKQFSPEQKLFPAPDWIAEVISKSTEKNDRGIKMKDYALHGVKEYWLVEPKRGYIEQYCLINATFFLHKIYSRGEVIKPVVFEGMHLPVDAVFDEEANANYRQQFFSLK